MNERKDEAWLDEQLQRAINTTRPEFNAAVWRHRYADAYEVLKARGQGPLGTRAAASCRAYWIGAALAAAAVILVGVALLLTSLSSRQPQRSVVETPRPTPVPARMVSMIALRAAYRRGGEEALDQQLDNALETLGPRPSQLSARDVLSDLEG